MTNVENNGPIAGDDWNKIWKVVENLPSLLDDVLTKFKVEKEDGMPWGYIADYPGQIYRNLGKTTNSVYGIQNIMTCLGSPDDFRAKFADSGGTFMALSGQLDKFPLADLPAAAEIALTPFAAEGANEAEDLMTSIEDGLNKAKRLLDIWSDAALPGYSQIMQSFEHANAVFGQKVSLLPPSIFALPAPHLAGVLTRLKSNLDQLVPAFDTFADSPVPAYIRSATGSEEAATLSSVTDGDAPADMLGDYKPLIPVIAIIQSASRVLDALDREFLLIAGAFPGCFGGGFAFVGQVSLSPVEFVKFMVTIPRTVISIIRTALDIAVYWIRALVGFPQMTPSLA